MQRRKWTAQEDALVRHKYIGTLSSELAAVMGRTKNSICSRAKKLGVKKTWASIDLRPGCFSLNGSVIGHLSEAEKGYIAGLLDGEGSITFTPKSGRRGGVQVQVWITNTDRKVMAWLKKRLGQFGSARWYKQRTQWKACGRFLFSSRKALVLLREIKDYLVIKQAKAELLCCGYIHLNKRQRETLLRRFRRLS